MSNKKWLLTDPEEYTPGWSRVFVTKLGQEENIKDDNKKIMRPIIQDKFFKFTLVYTDVTKMIGYRFDYRNREKQPKKALFSKYRTFNSMAWFFTYKKDNPKLRVLYEDQVLRLLMYEHANKKTDYWLVGRWREDVSDLVKGA